MKVFGVTGWKNTGKTWLIEHLVSVFTSRGVSVSTVKHAHHELDLDTPGRDSYRHREAGAQEVMLATSHRWALLRELRDTPEPSLDDLLSRLSPVDLVLVEGFKKYQHPKIETYRSGVEQTPRAAGDATIVAVASNIPLPDLSKTVFDVDDVDQIANFIASEVNL